MNVVLNFWKSKLKSPDGSVLPHIFSILVKNIAPPTLLTVKTSEILK